VYRVHSAGSDTNNGSSWAVALKSVTNALSRVSAGDEIWIAGGTYKPTTDGARTKSFQLVSLVALYGGFAGTETNRTQRNWTNNHTVLSGDIGTAGIAADNSYHVVVGATGAKLDGLTISDGFADDAATENANGGGLYCFGSHPVVANCIFSNNFARGRNGAVAGGGGVYWYQNTYTPATLKWYNVTFAANIVSNSTYWAMGGGMLLKFLTNTVCVISNCFFRNNLGKGVYGSTAGLELYDAGNKKWTPNTGPIVTHCTFESNKCVTAYPGGMRVTGLRAPVMLSNCVFRCNRVQNNDNSVGGGGLLIDIGSSGNGLIVDNCTFASNTAQYVGAGVCFYNGGGTNSVWRNCRFFGNVATNHGAGIAGAVDGRFENCLFSNNTARFYAGAGIRVHYAGVSGPDVFTNCTFVSNRAGSGALFVMAPVVVRNCVFRGNIGTGGSGSGGAAICWQTTTGTVRDCVFITNSCPVAGVYGGAIHVLSGATYKMWLRSCTLNGNVSGWYGGAVYVAAAAALYASDCTFTGNRAISYYGGAALVDQGYATFSRCVFRTNSATAGSAYGGALCFRAVNTSTCLVENCLFLGNNGNRGGAIATYDANVAVSSCTLYTNTSTAGYGAIATFDTGAANTCRVANTIIWANSPSQILPTAGVGCRYSCVQGGFAGTGNTNVNPLFVDDVYLHLASRTGQYSGGYFSGGTWVLGSAYSPIIDMGDALAGWENEPSPNGSRINMGAYANTTVASRSATGPGTVFLVF